MTRAPLISTPGTRKIRNTKLANADFRQAQGSISDSVVGIVQTMHHWSVVKIDDSA